MKTLFGVMGLSILSALVAVFAITELCAKPNPGASSIGGVRAKSTEAGVQPGDLLLAIDGKQVSTITQAGAAAVRSGKSAALLLQRDGMKIYIPLRLG